MSELQQNLLVDAYTNARYEIDTQPPTQFCIDQTCVQLANLLQRHKARCAAFISAFNPKSQILPDAVNSANHEKLIDQLKQAQNTFILGRSVDPKSQWPTEISVLIFDIPLEQAIALGRQFNQNAIVFIENDSPKLVWIN